MPLLWLALGYIHAYFQRFWKAVRRLAHLPDHANSCAAFGLPVPECVGSAMLCSPDRFRLAWIEDEGRFSIPALKSSLSALGPVSAGQQCAPLPVTQALPPIF